MLFELASNCAKLVNCDKFELLIPGREGEEQVCVMKEDSGALKLRKARKHRKDPSFILPLIDPTEKKLGEIHFFSTVNDRDRLYLVLFEKWGTASIYFSQVSV